MRRLLLLVVKRAGTAGSESEIELVVVEGNGSSSSLGVSGFSVIGVHGIPP